MKNGACWFRVPDNEAALMSLKPAQLKCYLVVSRAIQRDPNGGQISTREISARASVAHRHTHEALDALVKAGWLNREGRPGVISTYSLPHFWRRYAQ